MGTIEHRKLFRAENFIPLSFETRTEPFFKGEAITVDVSSIGIHMIGRDVLEPNTELWVTFGILKAPQPISALAKVVWQKPCLYAPASCIPYYATGVMFLDMTVHDAILTSDYIFDVAQKHQLACEQEVIERLEKQGK